jgi:hypothetical protein
MVKIKKYKKKKIFNSRVISIFIFSFAEHRNGSFGKKHGPVKLHNSQNSKHTCLISNSSRNNIIKFFFSGSEIEIETRS